jgi:hypothetical protein
MYFWDDYIKIAVVTIWNTHMGVYSVYYAETRRLDSLHKYIGPVIFCFQVVFIISH